MKTSVSLPIVSSYGPILFHIHITHRVAAPESSGVYNVLLSSDLITVLLRTELYSQGYRIKMKLVILVTLSCMAAVVWARPGATYTDKWDHINVDEILESQRLLKGYVDCLLDRGRCTPDGRTLKDTLPDALEHECSKCTKKQKEGSDKVIRFLVNKRSDLWNELSGKYDPDNKYQERYKDQLDKVKETS